MGKLTEVNIKTRFNAAVTKSQGYCTDRSIKQNRAQEQTHTHRVWALRQMGKGLSFHLMVLGQLDSHVEKDNDSTSQHVQKSTPGGL